MTSVRRPWSVVRSPWSVVSRPLSVAHANRFLSFIVLQHPTTLSMSLRLATDYGQRTTDNGRLYLSFKVVSAKSAKTSAAIQKRAMILDSFHPSNSKW